jgi:hypothetical protein
MMWFCLPFAFTESCRFPQHDVILFVCFPVMTAAKRSNKNIARQQERAQQRKRQNDAAALITKIIRKSVTKRKVTFHIL